jgi:two-component system, NarL family, response regulator DesR
MKLMIVDDHPRARAIIRELLAAPDVAICECGSGEEAVRRAIEFKPDWVTMDVRLPGINGFKAASEIQKVHPSARVIIVTADDQPYFQPLARSIGALGPVRKEECFALRLMLGRESRNPVSPPCATNQPNPSLESEARNP